MSTTSPAEFDRETGDVMVSYQIAGDHIAGEIVDGELIIVNLLQGTYFSSTGSAIHIWDALVSGFDMDEALSALGMRAENPAAFQLASQSMIATLVDNQAITPRPQAAPFDLDRLLVSIPDGHLAPPQVETHHDMKDILMLDPIHDVNQTGWPVRLEQKDRNEWED